MDPGTKLPCNEMGAKDRNGSHVVRQRSQTTSFTTPLTIFKDQRVTKKIKQDKDRSRLVALTACVNSLPYLVSTIVGYPQYVVAGLIRNE